MKMTQKKIGGWLKFIIVIMGLFAFGIHSILSLIFLVSESPDMQPLTVPWLIFIWATAIPMVPALLNSWLTAKNIGNGKSFCVENSKYLNNISISAVADSVIVVLGNTILLLMNKNHPSVFLLSMVVVIIGVAIFICAKGLSQLILQAADLQEQSDLTI